MRRPKILLAAAREHSAAATPPAWRNLRGVSEFRRALRWLLLPGAAVGLYAHAVSMSTGELRVDGPTAVFELRIPLYEVAQLAHPESELLAHFRFGDGHLARSNCGVGRDADEGTYLCHAEYEFPTLHPDRLQVQCTLFQATVPNHVHLLTASQQDREGREFSDQEVFDRRFTDIEVRFRPPSRTEEILKALAAGASRMLETAAGILCLIALAVAARGGKELLSFAATFLIAEWGGWRLGPVLRLSLSSRFLEALLALLAAYLAVELLLLPPSRSRWLAAVLMGMAYGFTFAGLPVVYLMGAMPGEALILVALGAAALRMPDSWRRPAAVLLLLSGLVLFGLRTAA